MAWVAWHTFSGCQVCPVHHKWLTVSVDWLTIDQKKKPRVFAQALKTQPEEIFPAAAWPCQVSPVSTHEQRSFHMQFWGDKMRNHVFYPIPLLTIKMLDK